MSQYTSHFTSSMAEKLKAAGFSGSRKPNHQNQNRNKQNTLPSPMSVGQDGVDHINISPEGKDLVGRGLGLRTVGFPFKHSVFSNFATIEGFWHYISTESHDDIWRIAKTKEYRRLIHENKKIHVPNFAMVILNACYERITQHADMKALIIESVLPFDCWYTARDSEIRRRPSYAHWLIIGMEEIRRALKEDRAPNFERFREEGEVGDDIHGPVLKLMMGKNILGEDEDAEPAEVPEEKSADPAEVPEEKSADPAEVPTIAVIDSMTEAVNEASPAVDTEAPVTQAA